MGTICTEYRPSSVGEEPTHDNIIEEILRNRSGLPKRRIKTTINPEFLQPRKRFRQNRLAIRKRNEAEFKRFEAKKYRELIEHVENGGNNISKLAELYQLPKEIVYSIMSGIVYVYEKLEHLGQILKEETLQDRRLTEILPKGVANNLQELLVDIIFKKEVVLEDTILYT